jgi:hypothetical protein
MNTPSLTVPGRTPINHNLNPNRKRRYGVYTGPTRTDSHMTQLFFGGRNDY